MIHKLRDWAGRIRFRKARSGTPEIAGQLPHRTSSSPRETAPAAVKLTIRNVEAHAAESIRSWQRNQTFQSLWLDVVDPTGRPVFRLAPDGSTTTAEPPAPTWEADCDTLPAWPPTRIENAALVAAIEAVDAVSLADVDEPLGVSTPAPPLDLQLRAIDSSARGGSGDVGSPPLRKQYSRTAESVISYSGESRDHREASSPPRTVGVHPIASGLWPRKLTSKRRILVSVPFLANGGVEHTLFATASQLSRSTDLDFAFVTLAPHRGELGDRRGEFQAIWPMLYSLGDLLHPDAMYPALLALIDSLDVRLLYNANGTTLFYDFGKRLRRDRPGIPIVDHLYDHEVGYITWYDAETPSFVDYCVAENRRIERKLTAAGWAPERVPVIWPCGRADEAFAPAQERAPIREALRRELGVGEGELLILTAARAHPQKRPLDWVRLAERMVDAPVRFVWIGGGELEGEIDAAIAASPARNLARLPFRDDIPDLLLAADVALLVSQFEGLPVFLLESIQAGTPFLATDVGDIADLAAQTGAGLVSGMPGDLAALTHGVRSLLRPELRGELRARAAAAAPSVGVEACANRYGELFRRALEKR